MVKVSIISVENSLINPDLNYILHFFKFQNNSFKKNIKFNSKLKGSLRKHNYYFGSCRSEGRDFNSFLHYPNFLEVKSNTFYIKAIESSSFPR